MAIRRVCPVTIGCFSPYQRCGVLPQPGQRPSTHYRRAGTTAAGPLH